MLDTISSIIFAVIVFGGGIVFGGLVLWAVLKKSNQYTHDQQ